MNTPNPTTGAIRPKSAPCLHLQSPQDMLERLHDAHSAVVDLLASAGRAELGMVSANNLAALLGLLNELQGQAVEANGALLRGLAGRPGEGEA